MQQGHGFLSDVFGHEVNRVPKIIKQTVPGTCYENVERFIVTFVKIVHRVIAGTVLCVVVFGIFLPDILPLAVRADDCMEVKASPSQK